MENNPQNKYDKEALRLLKILSSGIQEVIEYMEGGDAYVPEAIGGVISFNLLLRVRDALVRARMENGE